MSVTITTIAAGDSGASSLTSINNNFANLNAGKADTASPTFTGTVNASAISATTVTASGAVTATGAVTGSNLTGSSSGTNTGDQVISDATISISDVTTNNASTSKHGFVPKLSGSSTDVYRGDGTFGTVSGAGNPSGAILLWPTTSAPAGYLLCDGTAVSRTTNASLFAVIGTVFGSGDGSTTFNLPDYRGRMPVGKNTGTFTSIGGTGGEETHVLTSGEMPSHRHSLLNQSASYVDAVGPTGTGASAGVYAISNANAGNNVNTNPLVQNTGGGTSHNNLPPYMTINFVIKT